MTKANGDPLLMKPGSVHLGLMRVVAPSTKLINCCSATANGTVLYLLAARPQATRLLEHSAGDELLRDCSSALL